MAAGWQPSKKISGLNKSGEIGDMTGVLMQCTFANTPVVSPDNKKPRLAGFRVFSNCRFTSLPSWRSSAKHEWII
ncbi:hypothetical protein [Enterobacter cloacae]|uniref:hypothetical protein n=1 Tax=Enterobacter cloacae TaxID=550 RepID=UPI00300F064E